MPHISKSPFEGSISPVVVLTTSIVALVSGFLLGVYSIRGYLVSPDLKKERERYWKDPIESDESDIDEDDTILDHAPNWANGEDADRRQGLRAAAAKTTTAAASKPAVQQKKIKEECKLVLVVRTDLGMTKGKIAAQCGHATLACYKTLVKASQKGDARAAEILRQWESLGQAKIAVQTKSEEEMLELMAKARSLGVVAEVIQDAGRTQIAASSRTVLGVGPAPKSEVDLITSHLKLL
ncbi:peptidyl-tRNA hydrolase PTH2-domain-containing protein [Schizothecium vesticola]|uniref:peptidyl-tRNA hydrolase n=1 Tax=Schizothecium vesticola TaxID=314040 RepID=A0AA40EKA6_9PEZI|nr:peptidyl-tRNA hydrolase PTH2-domain-containing protein [Schizothecium vesticola]